MVLKPYALEPFRGWRRYVGGLLLAGLAFFCLIYGFYYALTTPFLITQFTMPVLLLGGLAIWALPDMKAAPSRTLEYLFFAFFVMAITWPNYLAISLPGLPWITSIRLIGFPLAFALLICVSVSEDFRNRCSAVLKSIPYLGLFISGFVAIQGVAVLISDKPIESLNAVIAGQISWTAIFFTACYVFLRPGNVMKWSVILWVCAIGISLLGVWEQRIGHVPWAGHIPGFLAVGDEYVQRVLAGARRLGTGQYRVQTIHSTSLGLAEFLALTTPFILHFMMSARRLWVRVAAAATLPMMFYTILATDARLGVVGFFMSGLLYALVWAVLQWRDNQKSIFGPAIVLSYPFAFCAFMAATFVVQRLKSMVWGDGATKYSDQGRLDQLASGIPRVLSHPQGHGASRGAEALGYHNLGGTLTIDNYYLLVALDYGILGFIAYYGSILIIIYSAAKFGLARAKPTQEQTFLIPLGISLSVFFVIKAIFSQTQNHTLQFMMMGMVAALVFRIRNGDAAGLPDQRNPPQPVRRAATF
ncbi:O-antigen ligase [Phenylobacterium sp.]|uniref:O-antigen ligase family protein n=1 Tax=Phenylobacterium sp. TaxID=1871053 RepID=UPI00273614AB|nr:O-antigen ligase family protein [Phenylobacterium sp.]MDP3853496.1 O-antigen ligase family protein [Phenylobacterium sp.]